jgi:diaminopimelate epimerase
MKMKTQVLNMNAAIETKLQHVVIARPGGNDTALVFDDVNPRDYKDINTYIQNKNPEIEQVMFVDNDLPLPKGTMAGGEFCGNATRSLGYYLLKGKDGSVDLSISGTNAPLKVVVKDKSAHTQMPIIKDTRSVTFLATATYQVKLEGITHLVFEPESEQAKSFSHIDNIEEQKSLARKLLNEYDLLQEPAAGVMALNENHGLLELNPFVYVRDVDTFYAETACGSGSVAVGLVLTKRQSHSIHNIEIRQPSGHSIFVDVDFANGFFEKASIKGKVDILYEGAF